MKPLRLLVNGWLTLFLVGSSVLTVAQTLNSELSLDVAIITAIDSDPWLTGSGYRESALINESTAASTLPDPKVSIMAANFPTDSFDIHQEAMTQLSISVTQLFPRGDTLSLSRRQKQQFAAQEPMLRVHRKAQIKATVTKLWLQLYQAEKSIALIEADRSLFEQLVDATRVNYSSALGGARQQDIVRAQLELTQLEDRLTALKLRRDATQQQLKEWIGADTPLHFSTSLPASLASPPILEWIQQINSSTKAPDQSQFDQIKTHPLLLALDQRIEAMETGVELARQKYRSEWGVTAQYGYREDDLIGRDRADLFTLGVTFDLPIFTGDRQDREVSAATLKKEALKTEKLLLTRQLAAQLGGSMAELQRLNQRRALYETLLLPQMAEQAEAALNAYNNDLGDFSETVRARIAELNAKIERLKIVISQQQTITTIDYLLCGYSNKLQLAHGDPQRSVQ